MMVMLLHCGVCVCMRLFVREGESVCMCEREGEGCWLLLCVRSCECVFVFVRGIVYGIVCV